MTDQGDHHADNHDFAKSIERLGLVIALPSTLLLTVMPEIRPGGPPIFSGLGVIAAAGVAIWLAGATGEVMIRWCRKQEEIGNAVVGHDRPPTCLDAPWRGR